MILVLSFGRNDPFTNPLSNISSDFECGAAGQSNSQALLCYGTVVGFSIIVSGDILKKLLSDQKLALDKLEISNNVLAVILFTASGITRVEKYNNTTILSLGKIADWFVDELIMLLKVETTSLLVSWQSSQPWSSCSKFSGVFPRFSR